MRVNLDWANKWNLHLYANRTYLLLRNTENLTVLCHHGKPVVSAADGWWT